MNGNLVVWILFKRDQLIKVLETLQWTQWATYNTAPLGWKRSIEDGQVILSQSQHNLFAARLHVSWKMLPLDPSQPCQPPSCLCTFAPNCLLPECSSTLSWRWELVPPQNHTHSVYVLHLRTNPLSLSLLPTFLLTGLFFSLFQSHLLWNEQKNGFVL